MNNFWKYLIIVILQYYVDVGKSSLSEASSKKSKYHDTI